VGASPISISAIRDNNIPLPDLQGNPRRENNGGRMKQTLFTKYNLNEITKELREIIPKCSPIPKLNKNTTTDEMIDAVNFLEQQGKYNQKITEG